MKIRKYESCYGRYVYFIELDKDNFFCFANEDKHNNDYSVLSIYKRKQFLECVDESEMKLYYPRITSEEKKRVEEEYRYELKTYLVNYLLKKRLDKF